jgi:hypothetical protein
MAVRRSAVRDRPRTGGTWRRARPCLGRGVWWHANAGGGGGGQGRGVRRHADTSGGRGGLGCSGGGAQTRAAVEEGRAVA